MSTPSELVIGEEYDFTVRGKLFQVDEGDPEAKFRVHLRGPGSVWFAEADVVSVQPLPWEVREGDVYLRNETAFMVKRDGNGDLVVEVTGLIGWGTLASKCDFTEAELIHRASA